MTRRFTALATFATLLGLSLPALAVGTRRFELTRGKDFEGGDLQGVAIDSTGRLYAGLNLGRVAIGDAQSIWSALARPDGSLLLGTGNEGKLLEVKGGVVKVLAESKALVIPSLISAWASDVLVATMPSGEIMRLKGGALTPFVKLEGAQHVWQLAYDEGAGVVYAATGPEGKLFRIDQKGAAQVYFDAEEEQLMSLALRRQARGPAIVYAGASDKAKLYEIKAPGRATVLYDFESTEVRALAVGKAGELYAIANQIKAGSQIPSSDEGGGSGDSRTKGKGVLFRFAPDGSPEQLFENSREHFVSLVVGDDGRPYVGTGVEGRVYSVDDAHNDVLVADTEERQVGSLLLVGKQRFVMASDPAVLHPVRGVGGNDSLWTSKPLDAGLRAQFGRLSWTSSGSLELSTRSGNTQEPDDTWSEWSPPLTAPGASQTPPGRYVQVRARWNRDAAATLSDVTLPFLTDNLRAVVGSIDVDQRKEDDGGGDGDLQSSGGPITDEASSTIKLKWKVDNPDSDELRYRLQYTAAEGAPHWLDILEPRTTLTKTSYDWDTSDLPEGRYRIRVQASDEISNPPGRVKRHELESPVVTVDNTPPVITALEATGRQVRGSAVDGVGPIARIELSVAGSGQWVPFYPRDGIYDQPREDFDVDVSSLSPAGRVLISVRVYDQANNFVVRHVTLSP
jgi:hypothetical protein